MTSQMSDPRDLPRLTVRERVGEGSQSARTHAGERIAPALTHTLPTPHPRTRRSTNAVRPTPLARGMKIIGLSDMVVRGGYGISANE